jgi:hypothetical protein
MGRKDDRFYHEYCHKYPTVETLIFWELCHVFCRGGGGGMEGKWTRSGKPRTSPLRAITGGLSCLNVATEEDVYIASLYYELLMEDLLDLVVEQEVPYEHHLRTILAQAERLGYSDSRGARVLMQRLHANEGDDVRQGDP